MLRISWTEHVTNEEVFNRANTKPTLLDGLLKRRLAFHGHLVRKGGITLDLMIGRLHGTRPRGRPRTTWLKDLTTQANISYKEAMTIPSGHRPTSVSELVRTLAAITIRDIPQFESQTDVLSPINCSDTGVEWTIQNCYHIHTLTLTMREIERINMDLFELWYHRRVLPRMTEERMNNEWVINRIKPES